MVIHTVWLTWCSELQKDSNPTAPLTRREVRPGGLGSQVAIHNTEEINALQKLFYMLSGAVVLSRDRKDILLTRYAMFRRCNFAAYA